MTPYQLVMGITLTTSKIRTVRTKKIHYLLSIHFNN